LLQKILKLELGWDENFPKDFTEVWVEYYQELPLLADIKINRCVATTTAARCELIGFCDASEAAYSAVVWSQFLRDTLADIRIVVGKTKVAPLKKISLPRLELCGAVLLARLIKLV
jgi:hypothetical protein